MSKRVGWFAGVVVLGLAAACGGSDSSAGGPGGGGDSSNGADGGATDGGGADADASVAADAGGGANEGGPGAGQDGGVDAGSDGGPPASIVTARAATIAGGNDTACAIDGAGVVRCWGSAVGEPQSIAPAMTFTDVAGATVSPASNNFGPSGCGVRSDGAAVCWNRWSAPTVWDTRSFKKVALGTFGSVYGVGTNGALYEVVATNQSHQLGVDTDWVHVTSSNTISCALKKSGALGCWTVAGGTPAPVTPGTFYRDVCAGYGEACAIRADGALTCWGDINNGVTTPTPVGTAKDWVHLGCGSDFACAIKSDGTLWCFGNDAYGQAGTGSIVYNLALPTQVGVDTDWVEVTGGATFTCAKKNDGTRWCWGGDGLGQLGRGTDHTAPVQIGAIGAWKDVDVSDDNACFVSSGGALSCTGYPGPIFPQNIRSNYLAVASPLQIGVATNWAQAFVGRTPDYVTACARADTGTLSCWGDNTYSQVGGGGALAKTVALPATTGLSVSTASIGSIHACALDAGGALYCWGASAGNLTTFASIKSTPTRVGADTWLSLAATNQDTCAVKQDGTLWCWGQGWTAPMQQIGAASNYVQVAAPKNNFQFRWALDATGAIYKFGGGAQPTWAINGSYKSITLGGGDIFCGIRTDGTLACASDNVYGQAGVGTIAPVNTDTQVGVYSDWVKVSSGGTMTCGLRAGGTVYCWGDNSRGTAGDGTAVSTVPVLSH